MSIKMTETHFSGTSARLLPWRRILVPTDLSKTSLRALDVAVPLARDHGAELFLLSVIEPVASATGMEGVAIAIPDTALLEQAKTSLPKIAERFVPPSVKVKTLVARGRAFEVITRTAKRQDVDLIVLTTHGRTGIDRFLLGSTAERVVRKAHCPVYILPSFRRYSKKRRRGNSTGLNHGKVFRSH